MSRGYRVRRRQLVLAIRPRLLGRRECRPGLGEFGGLRLAQHRCEGRERLVEPQVVPPGHRDQVPEPHVCHLVQHGFGAPLVGGPGDLAAKDVVLQEGHRARVFHCAGVEFGDEQLIVLAERVRQPKVLVVEVESLFGLGEQPLGVHVARQRFPAEDAQGDVPVFVGVGVFPLGIRAGDQGHQIGAHPRGGGKGMHPVLDRHRGAVGDHLPVRGRGHAQVERRLEVGLVEAGEHALGVGGFELRVQVRFVVDRVDEVMQSLTGVGVTAVRVDDEDVAILQPAQRDAGRFVVSGNLQVVAVEGGGAHRLGGEVDVRVGAGKRVEHHRGRGPERASAWSARPLPSVTSSWIW